jgi:hypothetical protein
MTHAALARLSNYTVVIRFRQVEICEV